MKRVRRWLFVFLEELMPPIAAAWAARSLADARVDQVDGRASEFEKWIGANAAVISEVNEIANGGVVRASTLESKVAGILTALALLTAAIAGIAIATWAQATGWERSMLLVSAGYSLIALLASLRALHRRPMFELTLTDIHPVGGADEQPPSATRVAALKLAYEEANTNPVIRLGNLLQVVSTSSRNAVVTGVVPLLGIVISHWS
jgi:hypothetical protein